MSRIASVKSLTLFLTFNVHFTGSTDAAFDASIFIRKVVVGDLERILPRAFSPYEIGKYFTIHKRTGSSRALFIGRFTWAAG